MYPPLGGLLFLAGNPYDIHMYILTNFLSHHFPFFFYILLIFSYHKINIRGVRKVRGVRGVKIEIE